MPDRTGKLKVTVAALTRDRPKMLTELLTSLSRLEAPENCDVDYLIVENNQENCRETLVQAFESKLTNGAIHYALESKLGIASARNRAAKEAIILGSDLLIFVDDDEVAPSDWLVRLVCGYRRSSAVLLGGPLRAAPLSENCTWLEKLMHRNISRRYRRNEMRAARQASLNDTPGVTVVTNNWIGQVDLFTNHKISFNEDLNWSGGEDTQFYSDVKSLGLKTGWVSDAPIYETIPKERLTSGYQFRRAKDQSNTSFKKKLNKKRSAFYTLPVSVSLKTIGLLGLLTLIPITLGATFLPFCRTAGWIAGRVSAVKGASADHYKTVTGE